MEKQKVELMGGDALQQAMNRAVLEAAMPDDDLGATIADQAVSYENSGKTGETGGAPAAPAAQAPKRRVGDGTPGPGRPKGSVPKVTKTIRDAVLNAFDQVGGVEYLVRLANGTQSDRAAFTGLLNKVLPTQINANVEGGIKLELSWLGGRSIGTTTAQIPEARTQVLDLEQDSDGGYRIKDPAGSPAGGDSTAAPGHAQSGPGGAQGGGT